MAKEANFGGIPDAQLKNLVGHWSSTARPASITDAQWIGQLVEKVDVLTALANEEHAAANVDGTVDVISVVMQCINLVNIQKQVIAGTASATQLVTAVDELRLLWKA